MKISTKGRYGLRVMMELAGKYGQGPVLAETIARDQEISSKYIHVIVNSLKSKGLVRASRGPGGGYELSRDPAAITALDVVSALEGTTKPVECVFDAGVCGRSGCCAARDVWCEVAAAVDGVLSKRSLKELSERQLEKHHDHGSYEI
jgi:Rrf2 family protein